MEPFSSFLIVFPLNLWFYIVSLFFICMFHFSCRCVRDRKLEAMEGDEHHVLLACVISGVVFSLLGSASFSLLWAVNWRPWRIYRYFIYISVDIESYFWFPFFLIARAPWSKLKSVPWFMGFLSDFSLRDYLTEFDALCKLCNGFIAMVFRCQAWSCIVL